MRILKKTLIWLLGVALCTALIVGGVLAYFYFNTDAENFEFPAVTAGGKELALNGYEWHTPVLGGILYRESAAPAAVRAPAFSEEPWTERSLSVVLPENAPVHLAVLDSAGKAVLDVNNETEITVQFPANGTYTLQADITVPERRADDRSDAPARAYGRFSYTALITVNVPPKAEFSSTKVLQGDVVTVLLTGFPQGMQPVIETELGLAEFCDVPGGKAAFIGIHYNREPGEWPVRVQCGSLDLTQNITVVHRDYPRREIASDVPDAGPAADEEWRNAIFPLYESADPEIYWSGLFVRPCKSSDIIGEYGLFRYLNGSSYPRRHAGIDYACNAGDPVWTPARGRVVFAAPLALTGNTVVVEHGGGLKSYFYHLDSILCTQGDIIGRETVVGTAGTAGAAGCTAAPHLHYEARIGNQSVDPELLFSGRSGLYFAF